LLFWVRVHCGIYKRSYSRSDISHLNYSPPPPFSFIPPPHIPGIVSTEIIFPFTYMCTQYLYHIHPSPSYWYQSLAQAGPALPSWALILYKKKWKKWHFCFFKLAYTGIFLVALPCIYIIAQFVTSPLFFFFLPWSLFYGGFSQFKILYSFLCREYINHNHLLNSLLIKKFLFIIIIIIIIVLGIACDIYQSSCNISVKFTPSRIPRIVSIDLISHLHMYVHNIPHIHIPTSSPHILPPPTSTNLPGRTLVLSKNV
jgi:hypothetical protein